MATYGGGVKITAAVSGSGTSGAIYSCPAGQYAIVQVFIPAQTGGSCSVSAGGGTLFVQTNPPNTLITGVYVGPGQSVSVSMGGGQPSSLAGVQFSN